MRELQHNRCWNLYIFLLIRISRTPYGLQLQLHVIIRHLAAVLHPPPVTGAGQEAQQQLEGLTPESGARRGRVSLSACRTDAAGA
jgi:hypothetical protein